MSVDTSDPATRAGASPARICSAPGRPRAARTAVQSPRSLTTVTTATFSDDMPRERTPCPLACGSLGIPDLLPENDSFRYGSSAWAETPSPPRMGWSCERIASRALIRMNQLVLTHAPQRAARRAGLSPAAIPST